MPVVMEAILGEIVEGRRTEPLIVMDSRRYGFNGSTANGVTPLVAEAASVINVSDEPLVHFVHGFANGHARAAVGPVLHDFPVFSCGLDELERLVGVVGTGL